MARIKMKKCKICKKIKPTGEFYKKENHPEARMDRCKKCYMENLKKCRHNSLTKIPTEFWNINETAIYC